MAPPDAFGYGDPLGRMELRTALADYLSRVRGVYAEPERIVICSGFHHGLTLIARALKARGARAVAVEAYGLDLYRALLTDAGLSIPPLPVDEHGARTDDLAGLSGVGAVLLTPAHQFPTGVALSPERRAAAIDWARSTGGLILEDDYDGEFRYDRKPVGALQGLDPDRVVYFGTASKSLAPALRVAWMVVPENLLPDVAAAKGRVEMVSVLDQLTLAEFITSGGFDRHVRSRRQSYRRRRDQLVAALAQSAPDVRVTGMAAGLQAVLELPPGTERPGPPGRGPPGADGQRDGGVSPRSTRPAGRRARRARRQLLSRLGQRMGGSTERAVQRDAVRRAPAVRVTSHSVSRRENRRRSATAVGATRHLRNSVQNASVSASPRSMLRISRRPVSWTPCATPQRPVDHANL